MKIVLITDVWYPQVNSSVRKHTITCNILKHWGYDVEVIEPSQFWSIPIPGYKDARFCYFTGDFIDKYKDHNNIAFHIATEGPLGRKAAKLLTKKGWKFTTSLCTIFPGYLKENYYLPKSLSWWYLKSFHSKSSKVMVFTKTMKNILEEKEIKNVCVWPCGVDTKIFKPNSYLFKEPKTAIYVGPLSDESNIREFLNLDMDINKWVVGTGPEEEGLKKEYPDVSFFGDLDGHTLALAYHLGSVFVFPGGDYADPLPMVRALVCGTPIAAFPTNQPKNIFNNNDGVGFMDKDLKTAITKAIKDSDPEMCRKMGIRYDWKLTTARFLQNIKFNHTQSS